MNSSRIRQQVFGKQKELGVEVEVEVEKEQEIG